MSETAVRAGADEFRTASDRIGDPARAVRYWLAALDASEEHEKDWFETAASAEKIHDGDKKSLAGRAFNILHANTQTLAAASYNSTPLPDVRPKHLRPEPAAMETAQVVERCLSSGFDEEDFDGVMRSAIVSALVPGRGVTRVRYRATFRPDSDMPEAQEVIAYQEARAENVPWRSFRRGPARSWADMPWVAFRHALTRDDVRQIADEAMAERLTYETPRDDADDAAAMPEDERSVYGRATVWEIWDRDTRRVLFIAPCYRDAPVAEMDDPLELPGFFPCPEPLQLYSRVSDLTPITPYETYRAQASELEEVSTRIIRITRALKARGIRAAELEALDKVAGLEDGEFAPSDGALSAVLQNGRPLDALIWMWPIDQLIQVLRELIGLREAIKAAIYEITGVSDIIRGDSDPNETATAQSLKAQWGGLRLSEFQREVQRYARDILRIKAHIVANEFTPEMLALASGGPVAPEIVQLLRDDLARGFAIDVETDSTVRGDLGRVQQNLNGFLEATGKFVQTVGPIAAQFPAITPLALALFGSFARTFKLGREVEQLMSQTLEQVSAQPQQQADPEADEMKRRAMEADVAQREAAAAKTQQEAQGQAIENALVPAQMGAGQPMQGFVG